MSDFIDTLLAIGRLEADRSAEWSSQARDDAARMARRVEETSERQRAAEMAQRRIDSLTSAR